MDYSILPLKYLGSEEIAKNIDRGFPTLGAWAPKGKKSSRSTQILA